MIIRVILIVFVITFSLNSAAEKYSFGVVPQQSAKKLAQLWTPILQHLSQHSGRTLQFETAKDIPTFEKRVAAGVYDFSYMNPYHYTEFSQSPGYVAIGKRTKQKIEGIIVVKKNSKISSLAELRANTLAFPSPAAFAASILPRATLRAEAIDFLPQYVSSHDSVYLGVAKGLFPAGGGIQRTLKNTNPGTQSQLRILWTSKAYTPHAFAAHPRVPASIQSLIQNSLVDMNKTEDGKLLLEKIKIKHGIEAAVDSDWDDVRALNIQLINSEPQT